MNIQLGIYELFSNTIPGCVYLVSIFQALIMFGGVKPESLGKVILANDNMPFVILILLLVAAYLLGVILNPFGLWWYKRFKGKDQSVEMLSALKQRHKDRWVIDFNDDDWHVLLEYLRSKNLDAARENERHQASSIMLRNVSFGFLLIMGINLWQYFIVWKILFAFISLGFLFLSLLMIRESMKFRRWYYDSILSSILAYRVDLEQFVKPFEPPAKLRKGRKG